MTTPRFHHERVTEHLLREISWTIANKIRDPRIPKVVTITEIKLSSDTRNATVFVSTYGEEQEKREAVAALNRASAFIQTIVSKRVPIRHFPKLCFRADDSIDRGMRIDELLSQVKDDLV
mgnify:CR=1 FL=1